MRVRLRLVFIGLVSAALSAVLPLYPLHEETRSFMPGGGGDRISHQWSLHTLAGALEGLRYRSDAALSRALLLAGFAGLSVCVAALTTVALRRWAPQRLGPR